MRFLSTDNQRRIHGHLAAACRATVEGPAEQARDESVDNNHRSVPRTAHATRSIRRCSSSHD